jgi:hypothetical protein
MVVGDWLLASTTPVDSVSVVAASVIVLVRSATRLMESHSRLLLELFGIRTPLCYYHHHALLLLSLFL